MVCCAIDHSMPSARLLFLSCHAAIWVISSDYPVGHFHNMAYLPTNSGKSISPMHLAVPVVIMTA